MVELEIRVIRFRGTEPLSEGMAAVAHSPADVHAALDIAAVLQGDRAAARVLVLEMTPRVRNLVRYLVRDDVDVDDIAQEAMVAVLKNLGDYRNEGAFTAWVDRIAARTTFKVLHRRKRRREEPLDVESAEPAHDAFGEFHSRRRLVALLDRLAPEQRHVVVLHYVLGMTVLEIGEELQIPEGTVRSRLRLAKVALRRNIESKIR